MLKSQSSQSIRGIESSTTLYAAWTDQRLLSVLETFMGQMPAHLSLCAFIDGLDEFSGDEDLLLDIVRLFSKAPQCKICVSSRPEQVFRQEFQECPLLRVQDFNYKDIHRMATGKLIPVLEKHLDKSEHLYAHSVAQFVDTLIEKASGVFLWLDLMIRDLIKGAKNGDTIEQLQSRLERAPATINGIYAHIFESLDPIYHQEGLRYFAILFAAEELEIPVTLLRLVCAEGKSWDHTVQFDLDYFSTTNFELTCQRLENRFGACCGGLIDISDRREYEYLEDELWKDEDMEVEKDTIILPKDREINFTHKTAMEYVRERYTHLLGPLSLMEANAYLAQGGIGFLTLLSSKHKCGSNAEATLIFGKSLRDTMDTISTLGHPVSDPNISKSFSSIQINLLNRMFRLLQEIHDYSYHSGQEYWSNETFTANLLDPKYS